MSAPINFPGSSDEIAANRLTHSFDPASSRCDWCDCRPWGIVAEWPCGTEPPRTFDPAAIAAAVQRIATG